MSDEKGIKVEVKVDSDSIMLRGDSSNGTYFDDVPCTDLACLQRIEDFLNNVLGEEGLD